jgi:predicted transcriptional regulator
MKALLWMVVGTRGGVNRARIIKILYERPYNANQLSNLLNLNYRTITHHLNHLEKMEVIESSENKYGKMYFLSKKIEEEYCEFESIWNQLDINNKT